MSKGVKHDQDKPDLSLLSSKALMEVAKVMTYGKKKYGAQNWRQGLEWSRVYSAVQRHLLAWNAAETQDPETGLNHLGHAMAGIMFLLEYSSTHPELDDRHGCIRRCAKHIVEEGVGFTGLLDGRNCAKCTAMQREIRRK